MTFGQDASSNPSTAMNSEAVLGPEDLSQLRRVLENAGTSTINQLLLDRQGKGSVGARPLRRPWVKCVVPLPVPTGLLAPLCLLPSLPLLDAQGHLLPSASPALPSPLGFACLHLLGLSPRAGQLSVHTQGLRCFLGFGSGLPVPAWGHQGTAGPPRSHGSPAQSGPLLLCQTALPLFWEASRADLKATSGYGLRLAQPFLRGGWMATPITPSPYTADMNWLGPVPLGPVLVHPHYAWRKAWLNLLNGSIVQTCRVCF